MNRVQKQFIEEALDLIEECQERIEELEAELQRQDTPLPHDVQAAIKRVKANYVLGYYVSNNGRTGD